MLLFHTFVLFGGVASVELNQDYVLFLKRFNPDRLVNSGEEELKARQELFLHKTREIAEFNNHSDFSKFYRKGVNKFSDYTQTEYNKLFGLNRGQLYSRLQANNQLSSVHSPEYPGSLDDSAFPSSFDWTEKGAVTKARNQGNCGGCWSFAGTEAIESALFLSSGQLKEMSPQAFIDCVPNPSQCGGTGGCEGATYDLLYKYANSTHGPVLESSYKYEGKDGKCVIDRLPAVATVGGWQDVQTNNYTALMAAVMVNPVAVGVAAMNWGDYMGGVYPSELCDGDIDHAVLLVGWGVDAGLGAYWKIKNSWGADWGENGYIRLQKKPDFCTIDSAPKDGFGCKDGPSKVKVCGACAIQTGPAYPVDVKLA
mmetsp:Transcript_16885/g.32975  ORF Transcript_16885/g.32975 Transcript_16885/m.32975 type:complete len:368 (-) Transcript_16885:138-1241(-)